MWLIQREYHVNLMIDNLPVIYKQIDEESGNEFDAIGFPIGY
jgi:hypothetical protein